MRHKMKPRKSVQLMLSDASWARMVSHITGDGRGRGASGRDNRMFVEGVLWVVYTGSAWRDLPERFGEWNTVSRRFSRWSKKGIWTRIFEEMADDNEFEYVIVDNAIIYVGSPVPGTSARLLKIKQQDNGRSGA